MAANGTAIRTAAARARAFRTASIRKAMAGLLALACWLVAGLSPAMPAAAGEGATVIASAAGPIALGAVPVTVVLETAAGEPATALAASGHPGRRIHLVLRDLEAAVQPGVLYHLYLGLPPAAEPAADDPRHAGVLNFFAAEQAGEESGDAGSFFSFDVTAAVRALAAGPSAGEPLTVTVRAAAEPVPGARATIGRIELVVR